MKTITFIFALFASSLLFGQYVITADYTTPFVDISTTGVALGLGDDDEVNILVPFYIRLESRVSQYLRIGNNGAILFGNDNRDVDPINSNFTTDFMPWMIAPYWDDFDSGVGDVYYQVLGTEPNRKLVVQWNRIHYDANINQIDPANFEVIFYENKWEIRFVYKDVDMDGTPYDSGVSATIGITLDNVSPFSLYSFNTSSLTNGMSLLFSPAVTYIPSSDFEEFLENRGYGNGIVGDGIVYTFLIRGVNELVVTLDVNSLAGIEYFGALEVLNCSISSLTSLDVRANTKLRELYCDTNQLTKLDVSQNPDLEILSCSENQLSQLDLSHNPKLENLNCGNNQIVSLDLSYNPALKELVCVFSPLNSLDVTNCQYLTSLWCAYSQITSLDVSNNPDLTCFVIIDNQLTSIDVSGNYNLQDFRCSNNNISALNVTGCPKLARFECASNLLTQLDVSHNPLLVYIDCHDNQIAQLDLSQNTILEGIDCDNNKISNLFVNNNPILNFLDCQYNQLTSLNISINSKLEYLNCRHNLLTYLDVTQNSMLYSLDCNSNQLASLNVNAKPELRYLLCDSNQIANLQLGALPKLEYLFSESNRISSLDVSSFPKLRKVQCQDNELTTLNLANGNNSGMSMLAHNNPNLYCIQVDDAANIPSYWQKDAIATYQNDCTVGVLDFEQLRIKAFPNPANNQFILLAEDRITRISIYTSLGQEVLRVWPDGSQVELDVSSLKSGVYTIFAQVNGDVASNVLVKE